jgi:hypothetical protein
MAKWRSTSSRHVVHLATKKLSAIRNAIMNKVHNLQQKDGSDDISRRRVLRYAGALLAATTVVATHGARAQQKSSKEAAQYQDSPEGDQQCSGCRFFIEGGTCEIVEGDISPEGWCRLYQPTG